MGLTSVLVTHDQEEAMDLADRIVLMDRGRIVQAGTPREIRDRPATAFVQAFLGGANRFDVVVTDGVARFVAAPLLPVAVALPDGPAVAYVEPHDLVLEPGRGPGVVRRVTLAGPLLRVEVDLAGRAVEVLVGEDATLAPGVAATVIPRRVRIFSGATSALAIAARTTKESSAEAVPEKEPTSIP
jgi:sulfate transport system ATP-binding protein